MNTALKDDAKPKCSDSDSVNIMQCKDTVSK